MTKEEYYQIRDEVYKNAGNDKFDFDLMLTRVVTKAVEKEREACAKEVEEILYREGSMDTRHEFVKRMVPYEKAAKAIRARGQK